MLFMILVKASYNSENENRPNTRLMKLMDDYNDVLEQRGVRIMAKGLHPSREGYRFDYVKGDTDPIVSKGPFDRSPGLIAGFFLIECSSMEEAYLLALQCPDPQGHGEGQIELRQVY